MSDPILYQDAVALSECLSHAPHYHACVMGPVPFGRPPGDRIVLAVNAILTPTREEAEEVVWAWVRRSCETYDHPFYEEEWEIVHLRSANCN